MLHINSIHTETQEINPHLLFPSDSPPEEPVRGAAAGLGIDSKRLCNEGARKALLDAAARAAADNTEELSCCISSSSSLPTETLKPPTPVVSKDTSSSRIICNMCLTMFPTDSSVGRFSEYKHFIRISYIQTNSHRYGHAVKLHFEVKLQYTVD
jgi:hypothetical protein